MLCADRIGFDTDDEAGSLELRARRGAEANGTLRKHGHRVADLNVAAFGGGDASGGDVCKQHHLLVTKVVWNRREIRLREWHQHVFGLRSVDRVAEPPAPDGAAALRWIAAQAVVALSAGRDGADENAVADLVAGYADAEFVNHADRFVSNDEAGADRIFSADDMQVCAADGGEGYADDGFAGAGSGDRDLLDANVIDAAKYEGLHCAGGGRLRLARRGC